jgi:small subunit ribosomal protein S18
LEQYWCADSECRLQLALVLNTFPGRVAADVDERLHFPTTATILSAPSQPKMLMSRFIDRCAGCKPCDGSTSSSRVSNFETDSGFAGIANLRCMTMNAYTKTEIKKLRKKRQRLKKKLRCRFCPHGCDKSPRPIFVDYKDLKTLRTMIDREGNMLARRKTGNCAKFQRAVREAILRARYVGLLPYVAEE